MSSGNKNLLSIFFSIWDTFDNSYLLEFQPTITFHNLCTKINKFINIQHAKNARDVTVSKSSTLQMSKNTITFGLHGNPGSLLVLSLYLLIYYSFHDIAYGG